LVLPEGKERIFHGLLKERRNPKGRLLERVEGLLGRTFKGSQKGFLHLGDLVKSLAWV